jgi:hypothetical protein
MLSARRSLETRCRLTTSCPGSLAMGLSASLGALRARSGLRITRRSGALLARSESAPASCSQVAAGGGRWLLMAVRGHLGDTLLLRRPGA